MWTIRSAWWWSRSPPLRAFYLLYLYTNRYRNTKCIRMHANGWMYWQQIYFWFYTNRDWCYGQFSRRALIFGDYCCCHLDFLFVRPIQHTSILLAAFVRLKGYYTRISRSRCDIWWFCVTFCSSSIWYLLGIDRFVCDILMRARPPFCTIESFQ